MYKSRIPRIAAELPMLLDAALRDGAEAVAARAKGRVPVDTGSLRDAIHTERVGAGKYAVIAGDSDVFYGHIVEHGGAHTPPHPFLIPALDESRDDIVAAATLAVRKL